MSDSKLTSQPTLPLPGLGPPRALGATLADVRDRVSAPPQKDWLSPPPKPAAPTPPYVRGSDTSKAAAESMTTQAPIDRDRCFAVIAARGDAGITCDEVEVLTGLAHQNASARVRELVQAGRIVDSGRRGATRSGRSARLYVVVTTS